MRIKAKVLILRPRKAVWNVLMHTRSWKTWYGRELCRVDPRWGESALLIWAQGQPKYHHGLRPQANTRVWSMSLTLHEVTDRTTMAAYGETIDGKLSQADLFAKQQQIQAVALALKTYVGTHGCRPFIVGLLNRVFGNGNGAR